MMCCFATKNVVEPVKTPKPAASSLGAEVPVTTKPVTLMFRIPSDDLPEKKEEMNFDEGEGEDEDEDDDTCNSQGEEVPVLDFDTQSINGVSNIVLIGLTLVLLYSISIDGGMNISLPYTT